MGPAEVRSVIKLSGRTNISPFIAFSFILQKRGRPLTQDSWPGLLWTARELSDGVGKTLRRNREEEGEGGGGRGAEDARGRREGGGDRGREGDPGGREERRGEGGREDVEEEWKEGGGEREGRWEKGGWCGGM